MDGAAGAGRLDIVQWLHEHRPEGCSAKVMYNAVANGHLEIGGGFLDVAQWLHAYRAEGCSKAAMDGAAANGHLHVVKWLHANRSEGYSTEAMDLTNSLEVLQWLFENRSEGCSDAAMINAAYVGNSHKLLFLKDMGLSAAQQRAADEAIMSDFFEIWQWLSMNYAEVDDDQTRLRWLRTGTGPQAERADAQWKMFSWFCTYYDAL
ncbi:hypothetical protein PybrP1_004674 [[Pythium] brassicae (nom. inval.)]|nr:hypothetical protein PybrP1_004674 [[Pythium] brassicae (nom. inval.)]